MYRLSEEMKMEVEWKGIEIHPEFPPEGIPVERYFNQGHIESIWQNVRALANQAGMEVKLPVRLSKSEMALLSRTLRALDNGLRLNIR